jgi:DNA-directed RNA polymerase specialized sigma subunit
MEEKQGQTFKILREKRVIPENVRENLKKYTKTKRSILDALKEGEMTIEQLSQKLAMPTHEVLFWVMTLVKYGNIQTGTLDDMDEYFTYKIKS